MARLRAPRAPRGYRQLSEASRGRGPVSQGPVVTHTRGELRFTSRRHWRSLRELAGKRRGKRDEREEEREEKEERKGKKGRRE